MIKNEKSQMSLRKYRRESTDNSSYQDEGGI